MTEVTAEELLDDVRTLRTRARRDRRASAFPLLLFGVLILVAPLCYVPLDLPPELLNQVTIQSSGPFPLFDPRPMLLNYRELVGWYWFLTIVLGFAATAWWYRKRAMRIGIEIDSRGYLVAAGASLAGFLVGVPLLEFLVTPHNTLYSTPEVNLPILIGSAVAAGLVLFWATRPSRGRIERGAGLFVGMLLATLSFSALGIYMIYGFSALLVITVALLALAWLERSVPLAVIGVLFGGASLLANLYNLSNLYTRLGWDAQTAQINVLQTMILPAAILIAGGIVVALGARR
jgi:hypothetical protein